MYLLSLFFCFVFLFFIYFNMFFFSCVALAILEDSLNQTGLKLKDPSASLDLSLKCWGCVPLQSTIEGHCLFNRKLGAVSSGTP